MFGQLWNCSLFDSGSCTGAADTIVGYVPVGEEGSVGVAMCDESTMFDIGRPLETRRLRSERIEHEEDDAGVTITAFNGIIPYASEVFSLESYQNTITANAILYLGV